MMVRTSMHLDCVVRMHGWAIKYGATNYDLPFSSPHSSFNHLHAVPPRISHQELGYDDPKDGFLVPKRKTLRCLTQKSQEIQETG
jgi:hypothetical protein